MDVRTLFPYIVGFNSTTTPGKFVAEAAFLVECDARHFAERESTMLPGIVSVRERNVTIAEFRDGARVL